MLDNLERQRALALLINNHGDHVQAYKGDFVYTAIIVNESKEHVVIVLRESGVECAESFNYLCGRFPYLHKDSDEYYKLDRPISDYTGYYYEFIRIDKYNVQDYFNTPWEKIINEQE